MPRVSLFLFLTLLLTACGRPTPEPVPSPAQPPQSTETSSKPHQADLPDLGPAPELANTTWLNVSAPLRLADLRGQVVLLDMWTFG